MSRAAAPRRAARVRSPAEHPLLNWLADNHFTFLGYRQYHLDEADGETVLVPDTGPGWGCCDTTLRIDGLRATQSRRLRRAPATRNCSSSPRPTCGPRSTARFTPRPRRHQDLRRSGESDGRAPVPRVAAAAAFHRIHPQHPDLGDRARERCSTGSASGSDSHSGKDLLAGAGELPP
ncbi:MAG: NAD-glutamate dehydrogenase [Actinomycetales bacterium]|nr:NAD-glutamate dehydrogenase [Actinomycetales bacterium]